MHFDILFTLRLPGAPEPILLVINVEIQNRENLSYPLESRAVLYACRLVGRQGADYADIKKVYSVWIVTNPEDENDQNTERTLVVATRKEDGSYEAAPETARLFEVHFLYLGETKDAVEASVIRMLDIIFSKQLDVKEKKDQLEAQFGIRMSAEVTREMEVMLNTELALESIARKEGMLEMGLAGRLNREVILRQLGRLYKDPKEAQAFFDAYVAEHPQEAAYLKN